MRSKGRHLQLLTLAYINLNPRAKGKSLGEALQHLWCAENRVYWTEATRAAAIHTIQTICHVDP